MSPSHAFQTDRLVLRAFEAEDLSRLHTILNHPDLAGRRYIPWQFPPEAPLSKKQVEKVLEKWDQDEDGFNLAVVIRDTNKLIGYVSCDWGWDPHCPNLSLVIAPSQQRRGYGGEVLQTVLAYLFAQTPAHNVSLWMADWNQPALQFAGKHAFQECGRWRRDGLHDGAFYDTIQLDILRPEWLASTEVG